ncbi:MAG: TonB-dependent receptor, partial [Burkholderiales bacterium]
YYLENRNGINYGLPWIRASPSASASTSTIIPGLDSTAYYGLASDRNNGRAAVVTLAHTHRFDANTELKTKLRKGNYARDLRASTIRFARPTDSPGNADAVDLSNLGSGTVLRRGTPLKIQGLDVLQVQSDLSTKFDTIGVKHEVLTGVDFSREEKNVQTGRSVAQGGVNLDKPSTTIGTPSDGASVDEGSRVLRPNNRFVSHNFGMYAQDLVQMAPHWKVLAGLRWDHMRGSYDNYTLPNDAPGPLTTTSYKQKISELSKRVGLLYQPSPLASYHFSYGTSFNTSGDTYSYNAQSANTPPEQSENYEIGAKLDSPNRQFTTRLALFYAVKKNERNLDPDTAASRLLLSGQRHSAGFEVDVTGRLTPRWEIYTSYAWMPIARVDEAAATASTAGNRVGDRPGLSPKHSGTAWNTYQITPKWRVGAGVNFRSAQAPADVTAPGWQAPGYATVDLMGEYAFNDHLILKASITNVADKYYAGTLYRGHYVPGAGRLALLTLTARF